MLLQSMTRQVCVELLSRAKFGRLACVSAGQPYVTPFSFVYNADRLYSFSTVGQKIAWMRANPLVCVEADEVFSRQNWASVIVLGHYEELPDTPVHRAEREHAYGLIQKTPLWWEPAYVRPPVERVLETVYFRIHIDQISGRHGVLEDLPDDNKVSWLRKFFGPQARRN
jgi:nitroimidazol reductase NimA-like FMN-containing flavoprotein (pyridoxamine 5'-phosphate oxidase superfamily)